MKEKRAGDEQRRAGREGRQYNERTISAAAAAVGLQCCIVYHQTHRHSRGASSTHTAGRPDGATTTTTVNHSLCMHAPTTSAAPHRRDIDPDTLTLTRTDTGTNQEHSTSNTRTHVNDLSTHTHSYTHTSTQTFH